MAAAAAAVAAAVAAVATVAGERWKEWWCLGCAGVPSISLPGAVQPAVLHFRQGWWLCVDRGRAVGFLALQH